MKIGKITRTLKDGYIYLSIEISHLPKGENSTLWYRFPIEFNYFIPDRHDALLTAMLPIALQKGGQPFVIDGTVSEQLLMSGANQFSKIWKSWFQNTAYSDNSHEFAISGCKTSRENFRGTQNALFFTGGVDSFYSLLKNLDLEKGENRISYLIYVQGFEKLNNSENLRLEVSEHLQEVAKAFGLNLILVSTNLRTISDHYVNWSYYHGAGIASVALWLSRLFRRVYFSADYTYATYNNQIKVWGTHPLTVPLFSTESTQFIHDGAEYTRAQKIFWRIAQSDIALKHLRVCWKNADNRYNCCRCEKCILTMVSLHIVKVLFRCETFEKTMNYEYIRNLFVPYSFGLTIFIQDNLEFIEQIGGDPDLKSALIESYQKHLKEYGQ